MRKCIEQFEKENNCINKSKLINLYGRSCFPIDINFIEDDKGYKYVLLDDISKIEFYNNLTPTEKCKYTNKIKYNNPNYENTTQNKITRELNIKNFEKKYNCIQASKLSKQRFWDNEELLSLLEIKIIKALHTTFIKNEDINKINNYLMLSITEKRKFFVKLKYGVDNYSKTQEFLDKVETTNLKNRGVKYPAQSKEVQKKLNTKESKLKGIKTKRKNGTLNTSKPEDNIYKILYEYFGTDKVERNYNLDKRYPFSCDFYIKSLDLFIECNFHWTHGSHWFNKNNDNDINKLNQWKDKNTKFYNNAINTWTNRDIKKKHIAEKNKLNYIVFWNENDIYLWVSLNCPNGQDWKNEYSWLPNRILNNKLTWKKLSSGPQTVIDIVKKVQFDELYKREIDLWNKNPLERVGTLQSNLYYNRLKYINKNPLELSDLEIIRGLNISGKIIAYSHFNNIKFKEFLSKYNIKNVYDPCAGWGERLITCASLGIKYFGIDINENIIEGHKKIIEHYKLIDQITICEDSSKYINVNNFDCTFTCPPYWNTEIYTDKGAENLSYDEFLIWWKHIILNSNTKIFAYQINQKYKDDMNKILLDLGYTFIEEIILNKKENHFTKNKKREYESIQVFKK